MAINTTKQNEINQFLTGKTSKDTESTDNIKSLTDRFSNLSNKEALKSDNDLNIITNKMSGSEGTSNKKYDNSSLDTKKNSTNDSIKRVLSSFSTKNTSNFRENQNYENLEIREIREKEGNEKNKEKEKNYNRESNIVLLEHNSFNDKDNYNELLAKAQDSYKYKNAYKANNFSDINIINKSSNNNTNSNSSTYNITTSYNKGIKSTNSIDNIKYEKNTGYELNSYRAIKEDLSNNNEYNSNKSKRVSSNDLINSNNMLNKINIDNKDESYRDGLHKKSDFLNNAYNSNNINDSNDDDISDIKNDSYYEFPRISKNNIIKQILIENDLYEDKKDSNDIKEKRVTDTHLHLNNNDFYQKNINNEINADDIYDINDSKEINDINDSNDYKHFSPLLINSYKDLNNIDNLNINNNNKFSSNSNSNNNENMYPNNRRISFTNNFNNMSHMNNNNNNNNDNITNSKNMSIYNSKMNGNRKENSIIPNNNKIAFINTNNNINRKMTLTSSTNNREFLLNNYHNQNTNLINNNNIIQSTNNNNSTYNKNQIVYKNLNIPYNLIGITNSNQIYRNNNAYINNNNSNFIQNNSTTNFNYINNFNNTNNANNLNNIMISNNNRYNTQNINNCNITINANNTNNYNNFNSTNKINFPNSLSILNNANNINNISRNNFISTNDPYINNLYRINNNLINTRNDNNANSIKSINMNNRIINYNHSIPIPTSSPSPLIIHSNNQSKPNNTNNNNITVNTTNTLNTKKNTNYDTDPNLQLDIKDLEKIESLCSSPSNKLLNMCFSYKPSRMIQALIEKIKATPKALNIHIVSKFIKTMISLSPMLIENEYSSFIYQKLIYLFTAKERISFWRTYKSAINQLCSHNIASYCVQDLILLVDNNKEEDLIVSNFLDSDLIKFSKENFSYLVIIKLIISLESRYKITKKAGNLINLFNLILSNLDELYNDMYGIHVIHHIIISISNLVNMSISDITNSTISSTLNVSNRKDFTTLKHKFISKIIKHLKSLLNLKYGVHCINNILEYLDNNVILFIANKITKHLDNYIIGEYFNIFLFKYITNITKLNLHHAIIPNFFSAINDYNNVLESLLGKKNVRLLLDSLTLDQTYYLKSHFSLMLKNQTQFPSILPLKELMIYYNIPHQINKNSNEDYLSNILINSQNTNITIDSNISINIRNIKYINKMLDSAMCIKLSNIAQTNNKIA